MLTKHFTPPPHKIGYSLFFFILLLVAAVGLAASLNPAQAQSANGTYDTDGDGLIEINNLEQLDAVRYDLDGNGRADSSSNNAKYAAAFPVSGGAKVCKAGCTGYELKRSLDFNDSDSYAGDVNYAWSSGNGWYPIGSNYYDQFKATLDGNGNTISNLYINRTNKADIGLFGYSHGRAVIRGIRLLNVDVTGQYYVGALVGVNYGNVSRSSATGAVTGTEGVTGGLVGWNRGGDSTVSYSYSTATVDGGIGQDTGGLVGHTDGTVSYSYATGAVTGSSNEAINDVGGLAGQNDGTIRNSYATGEVTGSRNDVGGLVGRSTHNVSDSYATGDVTSDHNYVGGLIGTGGNITSSYAIGRVSGNSGVGGLLGLYNRGAITTSYWNTDTQETGVGRGSSTGAEGKTTSELQAPTGRVGIYARWNPQYWDFGTSSQYPALKADIDGDGTATAWEFGGQGRAATTPTPTPTLPGAPAISSVTPGVGSLTVAWSAPSSNAGITAYDLRHILTSADKTADANWTVVDNAWTAGSGALQYQYTLTDLTGGSQYDVQARAVNSAGDGPWSVTSTGTPQTAGTPGTSDASRAFSSAVVAPSGQLTVTISGAGTSAAQVVETLPPGFSYVSHSPSDILASVSGQNVTFTLIENDSFTYTVTAPSSEGDYNFAGVLKPYTGTDIAIGGASTVTVSSVPVVTLSLTGSPRMAAVQVTATFTTAVTGFDLSDVAVANGAASNFATVTEGTVYTFDVTPSEVAKVTVNIAADAATDSGGKGNAAAMPLSFTPYDDDRDGAISKAEVTVAIADYFGGKLPNKAHVVAVIALYFASRS